MKFCKNLQRVVDISDPEWAPYWTNYKMLKVRFLSINSFESFSQLAMAPRPQKPPGLRISFVCMTSLTFYVLNVFCVMQCLSFYQLRSLLHLGNCIIGRHQLIPLEWESQESG